MQYLHELEIKFQPGGLGNCRKLAVVQGRPVIVTFEYIIF